MGILKALIYFSVASFLIACTKIKAKEIEGTYNGTERHYYQAPFEPTTDSTFSSSFQINRDKKNLEFLEIIVPKDSLSDGYYEFANPNNGLFGNYIIVKVDSFVCRYYSYNKFGTVAFKEYRGVKV